MVTNQQVTTESDLKPSTIEKEGTQQGQLQKKKSTAKGKFNSQVGRGVEEGSWVMEHKDVHFASDLWRVVGVRCIGAEGETKRSIFITFCC